MKPEPPLLTHPQFLDFDHTNWEQFKFDLQQAADGAFPSKIQQYDAVHALLISWEDDDLGCYLK